MTRAGGPRSDGAVQAHDEDGKIEKVRRFLADLYGVRIVDVEDDDIDQFRQYLTKHGMAVAFTDVMFR